MPGDSPLHVDEPQTIANGRELPSTSGTFGRMQRVSKGAFTD